MKKGEFYKSLSFKSNVAVIGLLVVFAIILAYTGYRGFTKAMLDQYADGAFHTARMALYDIDADSIEQYKAAGPDSEEYETVRRNLERLCNASDSQFIYVIQPDQTDYGHITFLFSTVRRNTEFSPFEFGFVRETTNDDYRTKYKKLYDGESNEELVIRDEGYIESHPHITAMMPVKSSDGKTVAIICIQRQLDVLVVTRAKYINSVMIVLIIVSLFVILGQTTYLNRVLIRPIKKITTEASRFAEENVSAETKLTDIIRNKDEIGQLADAIDDMEEQINKYVDDLTKATAEKERISTELGLAARIQEAMLPNIFPPFPEYSEFDIYALMDPARMVGGDFYDFYMIDKDHLGFAIADVSGKGIPAALFMMASKITLANHAKAGKTPAQIFEEFNKAICESNREEMFITVWLGILEVSTGTIIASNAGHEYPVVMRPDGQFEIYKDKHGMVLGAMPDMKYSNYEIKMEPGSKLFVYTDGVPEATNEAGDMFGPERLINVLNANADRSSKEILVSVHTAIEEYASGTEQFDDITMLCLEYKDEKN